MRKSPGASFGTRRTLLPWLVLALVSQLSGCADGLVEEHPSAVGVKSRPADFSYSTPGLVASHDEIVAGTPDGADIVDGPLLSFMVGGERRWMMTTVRWFRDDAGEDDFNVYHVTFAGDLDRPLRRHVETRTQWELFTNWDAFTGRWWIVNTYQADDGILAFVHVEFADGLRPGGARPQFGKGRLGLAWSNDGGHTFRYLDDIVVPEGDPPDINVEGAPYLVRDGFMYVYYQDIVGRAVARAPLDEVLAAARAGAPLPEWRKWNRGAWTPGIGGKASALAITGITHSDAAYSTETGRYYLATTTQRRGAEPSQILLFESSDALEWRQIDSLHPLSDVDLGWQYLSILDVSGADNGVVGRRFYIYCGREPINAERSEIHRIEVDLRSAGVGEPPEPAAEPGDAPPDTYTGVFRVGADAYYSNGSVYCRYASFSDFQCGTGSASLDGLTALDAIPGDLGDGGTCALPDECSAEPPPPPPPPLEGSFRLRGEVYYSNGSVYCQYESVEAFLCSTGSRNLRGAPSLDAVPSGLTFGGACEVPDRCLDSGPAYVGDFRVGADLNYSNGTAYCSYDTWEDFTCMTGMADASAVPVFDSIPSGLSRSGVCEVPERCRGASPASPPPVEGAGPAGRPYVGIFRVGDGLNYSNGAAYCVYDTWEHFMCITGMADASGVPVFDAIPSGLSRSGVCEVPERCQEASPADPPAGGSAGPAGPPYVGIFRVGDGLNYSNGTVYCYYDTWEHFMCMTGMVDASGVPVFDSVPAGLSGGGVCEVPPRCR